MAAITYIIRPVRNITKRKKHSGELLSCFDEFLTDNRMINHLKVQLCH